MTPLALQSLIILAAKYGPDLALKLIGLLGKKEVTVAEVEDAFKDLKPYEAYGIPAVAPTASN